MAPDPRPADPAIVSRAVQRLTSEGLTDTVDHVAVEAPLEIRLQWPTPNGPQEKALAITMRTPGDDAALAIGFLIGEGLIRRRADLAGVETGGARPDDQRIRLRLGDGVAIDWSRLSRHVYATSSCGVCGKTAIEALETLNPPPLAKGGPRMSPEVVHGLPERLRQAQAVFERTGGLHAAALFEPDGTLIALFEDVGRHNALDKLIGWAFLNDRLPLGRQILLVSGRASFELVQKALMAGLPVLAAVGAPSSLAVDLADEFDLTLLGFVRQGRFNVYSGAWRIVSSMGSGSDVDQ